MMLTSEVEVTGEIDLAMATDETFGARLEEGTTTVTLESELAVGFRLR
jgi:hypothetical protein